MFNIFIIKKLSKVILIISGTGISADHYESIQCCQMVYLLLFCKCEKCWPDLELLDLYLP